ncbi:MAG: hypothetical protein MUF51_02420 [Vicinamibacteria bacterium]|jgi:hypothetical protein|nr:hypothetical protein [Vicinamibacteria bacterium]
MSLKILVAGVDKDTRPHIENMVKQALGWRATSAEAWSVSLVKVAAMWSVTLNGPGADFQHRTFSASQANLGQAILDQLTESADPETSVAAAEPIHAASGSPGRHRDQHVCGNCQQIFFVTYDMQPEEARVQGPVACPYCWQIKTVEIGEWAMHGSEYHAERSD